MPDAATPAAKDTATKYPFDTSAVYQAVSQIGSKRRDWAARLAFLSGARWGAGRLAHQIDDLLAREADSQIDHDALIDAIDARITPHLREGAPR